MTRIGFVGLGRMGAAMAPRLLGPGRTLTVWNRSAARAAPPCSGSISFERSEARGCGRNSMRSAST